MKDMIEFVNSVKHSDFEQAAIRFFDETVCLYNIIGNNNYKDISSSVDENNSISFLLEFDSIEDIEKMDFEFANSYAYSFNRNFKIIQERDGLFISVKFIS